MHLFTPTAKQCNLIIDDLCHFSSAIIQYKIRANTFQKKTIDGVVISKKCLFLTMYIKIV